ncbi:phytanoyl-CoA dioxygenase family protein [Ilumatobacter sp.]|uniref:phytanoyl-CoA dioxygenase family protein n=1 Tax=Ilumatobacter sp. TaxID=1967498 RepID=UPI00375070DD
MIEVHLRQSYERDGYVFPLEVMMPERAAEHRAMFESVEAAYAEDVAASKIVKGFASIVLPFVDEIMRLPSLLRPVKAILGDDLLVMGANFFIKEPATPAFVSWHQDLTYWGYDGVSEVTAWVALTAATPDNGCMRFVPGSHKRAIVGHRETFGESNMLSRGQEISVEVDENEAVDDALQPGEMSLHHGHLFHASNPNTSADRRIGLVIRYVTPAMKQASGQATFAHLVAGEDRFGNFELLPPATEVMADGDVANARRAIALQEQIGSAGAADRGKRIT